MRVYRYKTGQARQGPVRWYLNPYAYPWPAMRQYPSLWTWPALVSPEAGGECWFDAAAANGAGRRIHVRHVAELDESHDVDRVLRVDVTPGSRSAGRWLW